MLLTSDQEAVRDAVRDFCQAELWPHAARWDREHHFPADAHRGLAELGAYGICVPEADGGAGPDCVTLALVLEEIAAGDGGTSTAISVTNCPVNAILMRHGDAQQKKDWLWPLAQGRMLGAFCLTEPQAGSDLGQVRTQAVPHDTANEATDYRVAGTKIFTSGGEHDLTDNIVHLVLARLPGAAPGPKGLSLFLVPKVLADGRRNAVVCVRIEEKMGLHGSPTCVMRFDDATGWLIGTPAPG